MTATMKATMTATKTATMKAAAVGVAGALALVSTDARAEIRHVMDANEGGSDVSSLFYSPSVAPGEDRFLLLSVTTLGPTARVVSASYGVAPLTFYGEVSSPAGNCRMEWWGLVAPAEGVNPLRLSLATATANLGVTTITYTGVDQLQPTGPMVPASGPAGPLSVTVPSAPGQVVLDGACGFASDADIDMAGPGQVPRWHWRFGPHASAGSEKPGAAQVNLRWTTDGPGALEWAAAGIALRPAGGGVVPVKLAVDTAGCAVGGGRRHENDGSVGGSLLILLASLGAGLVMRRRRGVAQRRAQRGNIQGSMAWNWQAECDPALHWPTGPTNRSQTSTRSRSPVPRPATRRRRPRWSSAMNARSSRCSGA
jgi:hypothetical protein